jgi:hypothetical protein
MSSADVVRHLNQLLVLHGRSLPVYLGDARPWLRSTDQAAFAVVQDVAQAHRETRDRLAEMVLARGGTPADGEFPMVFTGYNDLSLEFLLGKLIARGEQAIALIRDVAARLGEDNMAQAVAEELAGEAIGHVDSLKEAQGGPAPALKVTG